MHGIGTWLERLFTHDFFPGVNTWVYWVKRPIFTLLIALAMFSIMLLRPRGLWPAREHGKAAAQPVTDSNSGAAKA
jgi:hypothetical protein